MEYKQAKQKMKSINKRMDDTYETFYNEDDSTFYDYKDKVLIDEVRSIYPHHNVNLYHFIESGRNRNVKKTRYSKKNK